MLLNFLRRKHKDQQPTSDQQLNAYQYNTVSTKGREPNHNTIRPTLNDVSTRVSSEFYFDDKEYILMSEKEQVRETINALYEAGNVNYRFRGEVSERTVTVLTDMVKKIQKCSSSMSWVPRPTGRPSVSWAAKHLGKAFIRDLKKSKVHFICISPALRNYRTPLEESGY